MNEKYVGAIVEQVYHGSVVDIISTRGEYLLVVDDSQWMGTDQVKEEIFFAAKMMRSMHSTIYRSVRELGDGLIERFRLHESQLDYLDRG